MSRFVFGLGTGGCGTHSLVKLLCCQPRVRVAHEELIQVWSPFIRIGGAAIIHNMKNLLVKMLMDKRYDIVGDVGYTILPYVDLIMALYPDSKFICLQRDRDATIKSIIEHMGNRNQLIDNGQNNGRDLPKIPRSITIDRNEAAYQYYDMYYDTVNEYMTYYIDSIKIFNPEVMWTAEGQKEILFFAGIDNIQEVPKEWCNRWVTSKRKAKIEERYRIQAMSNG